MLIFSRVLISILPLNHYIIIDSGISWNKGVGYGNSSNFGLGRKLSELIPELSDCQLLKIHLPSHGLKPSDPFNHNQEFCSRQPVLFFIQQPEVASDVLYKYRLLLKVF